MLGPVLSIISVPLPPSSLPPSPPPTTRTAPPVVPSRKSSRGPPQRPPKPGRPRGGVYHDDLTESQVIRRNFFTLKKKDLYTYLFRTLTFPILYLCQDGDDSSSTVDEESANKKENTEWYEYGCV